VSHLVNNLETGTDLLLSLTSWSKLDLLLYFHQRNWKLKIYLVIELTMFFVIDVADNLLLVIWSKPLHYGRGRGFWGWTFSFIKNKTLLNFLENVSGLFHFFQRYHVQTLFLFNKAIIVSSFYYGLFLCTFWPSESWMKLN
jgi:hypothetical protein